MHIATIPDLPISVDIMHKYAASLDALKTMMRMLSDELDRGAQVVYPDAMEVRSWFQTDVTVEHTDTIRDYQSWHQYVTVDQHEDVKKFDFYSFLCQSGA